MLYPKYHIDTGLLALKLAKLTNFLGRMEDAKKYIVKAKDVLEVTHGKSHSLVKYALKNIQYQIELEDGVQQNGNH